MSRPGRGVRPGVPVPADLPLSVLELSVVGSGQSSADALGATTQIARLADRLGYRRLWVAEHHNMAAAASTSPPVLLAHLAAHTDRIRVGSGGVMLPNHPPLVVAEQFALLEALHPGRIDVGLGRAPGTDPRTAAALRRSPAAGAEDEFVRDIQDLWAYLCSGADGAAIAATPAPSSLPELWILGSSLSSAFVAAALGLPYAFAHHFSADNTLAAVATYRERFRPSELAPEPRVLVTSSAVAADTDAEARELALPGLLHFADLRRGIRRPLRTVAEAREHDWTAPERAFAEQRLESSAVGSAATVRARLDELAEATGADELMIVVQTHGVDERLRTLQLLAPDRAVVRSS